MSDRGAFWYVLFVKTGNEEQILEKLRVIFNGVGYPFVPKKVCVFRRQGQISLFKKVCFPGYIFIESKKCPADFLTCAFRVLFRLKGVYKFLHYGDDKHDIVMRENEKDVFCAIFGVDYCIDSSIGFKDSDLVRVISGSLVGSESRILKVNRNRREAVIGLNMFGSAVEVSVCLELIEKIQ